jgi:hypothetical protein
MFSLDPDTLWKSAIRRQMGFDFHLEEEERRFIVTDETNPELKTYSIKPQGLMNEKAVANLVRACMRLKKKHEDLA